MTVRLITRPYHRKYWLGNRGLFGIEYSVVNIENIPDE